ncbi:MAG TPA: hypothetical protein VF614_03660 [Chthoniobacteraceae bacterium]|jgi:hypothetical protein
MTAPDHVSSDAFYQHAMQVLQEAKIDFLVGGAYALRHYTGIIRDTKDFDIFLRPKDIEPALNVFQKSGYRGGVAFPHWLAKVHHGENFIDLVYRAGNGLCEVDDAWFSPVEEGTLLDMPVRLCPPDVMIWQKAYIMERERFDGGDIAHLLRSSAERIDWPLLLERFGPDWRVLFSHLMLFGFIYPGERHRLPPDVMRDLLGRMAAELESPGTSEKLCQGTYLSRGQYLPDIERWGYRDVRTSDRCYMDEDDVRTWTNAISQAEPTR